MEKAGQDIISSDMHVGLSIQRIDWSQINEIKDTLENPEIQGHELHYGIITTRHICAVILLARFGVFS